MKMQVETNGQSGDGTSGWPRLDAPCEEHGQGDVREGGVSLRVKEGSVIIGDSPAFIQSGCTQNQMVGVGVSTYIAFRGGKKESRARGERLFQKMTDLQRTMRREVKKRGLQWPPSGQVEIDKDYLAEVVVQIIEEKGIDLRPIKQAIRSVERSTEPKRIRQEEVMEEKVIASFPTFQVVPMPNDWDWETGTDHDLHGQEEYVEVTVQKEEGKVVVVGSGAYPFREAVETGALGSDFLLCTAERQTLRRVASKVETVKRKQEKTRS
jgi:hypothetical protein